MRLSSSGILTSCEKSRLYSQSTGLSSTDVAVPPLKLRDMSRTPHVPPRELPDEVACGVLCASGRSSHLGKLMVYQYCMQ